MRQPQFIMLTGEQNASWVNINEIVRADVTPNNTIILQMKRDDGIAVNHRQDVQYVQAMLNSLARLVDEPERE